MVYSPPDPSESLEFTRSFSVLMALLSVQWLWQKLFWQSHSCDSQCPLHDLSLEVFKATLDGALSSCDRCPCPHREVGARWSLPTKAIL